MLVGGLGSSGAQAGIDRLDTAALGYADDDVIRFSYTGGRAPEADEGEHTGEGDDGLPGGPPEQVVGVADYTSADSQVELGAAAHRLATELRRLLAAEPGVPLDLLAHSQGGLVARLALDELARQGVAFPPGSVVVTLGTPHRGAELATGLVLVGSTPLGAVALDEVHDRLGIAIDPASAAVRDLAEDSPAIRRAASARLPEGVHLRSIAARGDLVVPNGRSRIDRAAGRDVVVSLTGIHAHDTLPADPDAHREVALALAGLPPTCRSLATALADHAAGEGIATAEQGAFLAAAGLLGAP